MTTFSVPFADAEGMLNYWADQFDGAAGTIEIRTGAEPANCEAASSGTLLATVTLAAPAFGAAADQNPGARVTLLGVPLSDLSIDATGTAGYFRFFDNGGTCRGQGDVGTSGATMIVDTVAFQANAEFEIQSCTVDHPES